MTSATRPAFETLPHSSRLLAARAQRNSDGVAFVDEAWERKAADDLTARGWGVVRHLNGLAGSLCWFELS